MKTHTASARGKTASIVIAAVSLASFTSSAGQELDAEKLTGALCSSPEEYGSPLVMVGPRVAISRRVAPDATMRASSEWLQLARANTQRLIAVSGAWVVLHDVKTDVWQRRHCAAMGMTTGILPDRPLRIAVSEAGDVAATTASGITFVYLSATGGSTAQMLDEPIEVGYSGDTPPDDLLWHGRRLVLARTARIDLVDFDFKGTAVARVTPASQVQPPTGAASHAFAYNGLTYFLRGRCLDVHVGSALAPRLRESYCLPPMDAARSYVIVDRATIRVFGDTITWQGSRPSVVTAQMSGSTRDLAVGLTLLTRAEWLPRPTRGARLQFTRDGRPVLEPGVGAGFWEERFTSQWFASDAEYRSAMIGVSGRGWLDLVRDGAWYGGSGVAFRPREGVDFVHPGKRTLTDLAAQIYRPEGYSDALVLGVLKNNSRLSKTLEGQLLSNNWVPIGARTGSMSDKPQSFEGLARAVGGPPTPASQARSQSPQAIRESAVSNRCADAKPADQRLSSTFRRGVTLAGAIDRGLAAALGNPELVELKAENAVVLMCRPARPAGRTAAASDDTARPYLVLEGAKLRGQKNSAVLYLDRAYAAAELTFRSTGEAEWPVAIEERIAVGVAPPQNDPPAAATRAWLDRLLPHFDRPLLLPVTSMDVAIVVEAGMIPSPIGVPTVTLASAEAAPARARGAGACSPAEATTRRSEQELLIGLQHKPLATRAVEVRIGVAENAVALLDPVFDRASGRLWMTPSRDNVLEVVKPPLDPFQTARRPDHLSHGTRVAALLGAQNVLLPGLLKDVDLVWVDLQVGADANLGVLNTLAGLRSIVNVSQKLDGGWTTFDVQAKDNWNLDLLFVAAAANDDDPNNDHGLPIKWRPVAKTNVVSIGVAQSDGTIAAAARYNRDDIDLLAPGVNVPSVNEHGVIECDNGTSFAAAYASAVAALVADAAQGVSVGNIRARLMATASWRTSYRGKVKGGLLDAGRALKGLDDNLLTVRRPESDDLVVQIDLARSSLLTFTPMSKSKMAIAWENVLRLQRLPNAPGSTANRYRVAFVTERRFLVEDEVIISPEEPVPVLNGDCTNDATGKPADCFELTMAQVIDYVARMPNLQIREF